MSFTWNTYLDPRVTCGSCHTAPAAYGIEVEQADAHGASWRWFYVRCAARRCRGDVDGRVVDEGPLTRDIAEHVTGLDLHRPPEPTRTVA